MGKHLTEKDIERVVEAIDTLGDVTWENVVAEVKHRLGRNYTRQALSSHARIKIAYETRKTTVRKGAVKGRIFPRTDTEHFLVSRVDRLERQVQRLEAENAAVMRQFVIWAYNAHALNIATHELDRPLPATGVRSTEKRQ